MKLLKEWKIWLVIILVIASFLAIEPRFESTGVIVKQVFDPASNYLSEGVIITKINGAMINNISDYNQVLQSINPNQSITIEFKEKTIPYIYSTQTAYPFLAKVKNNKTNIGLVVNDVKTSNLNFGLEMVGGTKVLLKPEEEITDEEAERLMETLRQRLNVYQLQEITVAEVKDLEGNRYIRVEFAGATQEEVVNLVEKQGKFEAKIGDQLVFDGEDIKGICFSGSQCTLRIFPRTSSDGQTIFEYYLQVDISQKAAENFAKITNTLEKDCPAGEECFLNETIDFYIDDNPVEGGQLKISGDIQGKAITSPVITGARLSQLEAENEIKRMQAILQSGKLPVKLSIEKVDTISPLLGREFAKNIFLVLILAIIAVDIVMAVRYRTPKIIIPMIVIALIEIFATLGVASIINWTLDLPSIAGLIAAVGTGLNDQIIITDEVLRGKTEEESASMKKRISRAFFIVIAAYVSVVAAMTPLAFAGAGLLRGFAITTIIAVSIGVIITRPAYAKICEHIIKE